MGHNGGNVGTLRRWVGAAKYCEPFLRFHALNPHVYEAFCRHAERAVREGRRHIGAHLFVQQLRWSRLATVPTDDFKISNTHFPFYARLFALDYPAWADLFRLKVLHDASGRILEDSATLPTEPQWSLPL